LNLLLFTAGEAAGQWYKLLPDSIYNYTFNRESQKMDLSSVNYNYYTIGVLDSTVTADKNLIPVARTIYTYESGNMTKALSLVFSGGNWLNSQNQVFYYDGYNVLTERIVTKWSGGQWQNLNRFTYLYDENNRLAVYNREFWRTSSWTDFSVDSLFYDDAGFLTERSARLESTGQYVTRTLYYYDPSGLKSYQTRQDFLNNEWTDVTSTQYYYNRCGTQMMSETEKWLDGSWQPDGISRVFLRIELAPGARKVPVCHKGQTINVLVQTLNVHLSHGDCIGECMAPEQVTQQQTLPAYNKSKSLPFIVYPNPTEETVSISITDNNCPVTRVELLDFNGRSIRSFNAVDQGSMTIDMNSLKSGKYIIRLTSDTVYSTIVVKK
jgi:hypothetical protein